jgi:phosphocarrier protein
MPKIEKEIIVANKKGIHARPAALFVQLAEKFDSTVTIVKDDEKVNGKSIMGILMLGAHCGVKLKLVIEGADAEQAVAEFEIFLSKQEEELMQ